MKILNYIDTDIIDIIIVWLLIKLTITMFYLN